MQNNSAFSWIKVLAKDLGAEVPLGYAQDAKGNAKRRAKQDIFVTAKLEAAAAMAIAEGRLRHGTSMMRCALK
jgi:hypothetical protein